VSPRAESRPAGAAPFGAIGRPADTTIPEESFTIPINVAVAGPTSLLAAIADRRWVLTALVLVASGAVTVQLNSGATPIAGPMALAANVPLVVVGDAASNIMRALNVNEALTVTLGAAVQVGGWAQGRWVGGR
jgi:hypothetical protein